MDLSKLTPQEFLEYVIVVRMKWQYDVMFHMKRINALLRNNGGAR